MADFGAKGDGKSDDTAALQRALDASVQQRRRLEVPSGTYIVSQALVVNGKGLRLAGESKFHATIRLRAPSTRLHAMLLFNTSTEHNQITELTFDAAGGANYSVFALEMTRSTFRAVGFNNGNVAGLRFGFGWLNFVEDCSFKYNGWVGLYMYHGVNSINVVNSIFEANAGAGILVNEGHAVLVQGNTIETNGGPAIIVNQIGGLTVRGPSPTRPLERSARLTRARLTDQGQLLRRQQPSATRKGVAAFLRERRVRRGGGAVRGDHPQLPPSGRV